MTEFINLDDYMTALSTDRQQIVNNKSEILSQSIELAKLRKAKRLKQTELAVLMGVSQAHISRIESGKDIQLSTLQHYIEALGGKVSITAKMPSGDVSLI